MDDQLQTYGDFLDRKKDVPLFRKDFEKWDHTSEDAEANPVNKGGRIMSIGPLLMESKTEKEPVSQDKALKELLHTSQSREVLSRNRNRFESLNRQRIGDVQRHLQDKRQSESSNPASRRSSLVKASQAPAAPISRPVSCAESRAGSPSNSRPGSLTHSELLAAKQLFNSPIHSGIKSSGRVLMTQGSFGQGALGALDSPEIHRTTLFRQWRGPSDKDKFQKFSTTLPADGTLQNQVDFSLRPKSSPGGPMKRTGLMDVRGAHTFRQTTSSPRKSSGQKNGRNPLVETFSRTGASIALESNAKVQGLTATISSGKMFGTSSSRRHPDHFRVTQELTSDPRALKTAFDVTMGSSLRPRTSPSGAASQRDNLSDLVAAKIAVMDRSRPQTSPQPDRKVKRGKPQKKYRWQEVNDLALPAVRTARQESDLLGMSFGRSTNFGTTANDRENQNNNANSVRVIGEKNMPKYRVERKLKESKQDGGAKLFERLEMYKEAHRKQVKKMLQDSGHNYQTENKMASGKYVEWFETQRKQFMEKEYEKASLNCTRRKLHNEEKIKRTLQKSSEARGYKRLRDRAVHALFVERLKTHQSSIKSRWIVTVLLAARTLILVRKHQARQLQLLEFRAQGAALAINKFMTWQWQKRNRQRSAKLIMQFLEECSMEQKMKIFCKRVRRSVIKVQRYWRARLEITEAHITLLCLQWDSLLPKLEELTSEDGFSQDGSRNNHMEFSNSSSRSSLGVSISDEGSNFDQGHSPLKSSRSRSTSNNSRSDKKQLLKKGSQRSLRGSSNLSIPTPGKKSSTSKKNRGLAAASLAIAVKAKVKRIDTEPKVPTLEPIPTKIKLPLIERWLKDHRQRYCNDAFMFDEYDLWPVLVELVRVRSLMKNVRLLYYGKELGMHEYCKQIRLHGKMRQYIAKYADEGMVLPQPPIFRRFLTLEEAVSLHKQAKDLILESRYLSHTTC